MEILMLVIFIQETALGATFMSFEDLLKTSDIVIVSCSLNKQTEKLFNIDAFKLMKPSAIFVNGSRGGVVEQDALYEALTTGLISAAGLDVMTPEPLPGNHPLTTLKNCYLLPHIGSATVETRVNMATITAKNIIAGLEGQPLPAEV